MRVRVPSAAQFIPTIKSNFIMAKKCASCPLAVNAVNGRYCTRFKLYVPYLTKPLCEPDGD